MFYLFKAILSLSGDDYSDSRRLRRYLCNPSRLDKAQAEGYKILGMKFLSYFLLILLLAMAVVPAAVKADG